MFCDEPTQASQLSACDWWIVVKMAVAALFAVAPSWVTQMQSKYGVQVRTRTRPSEPQSGSRAVGARAHEHLTINQLKLGVSAVAPRSSPSKPRTHAALRSSTPAQPADIANAWDGIESATGAYGTMGWYWHWPADADDNRGLGCAAPSPAPLRVGPLCAPPPAHAHDPRHTRVPHPVAPSRSGSITWAWDDELCKETSSSEDRGDVGVFEDVFNEARPYRPKPTRGQPSHLPRACPSCRPPRGPHQHTSRSCCCAPSSSSRRRTSSSPSSSCARTSARRCTAPSRRGRTCTTRSTSST